MKSIFKTFVLMLISFSLFAQQDSILTKAENIAWLENFKKIETKAEQVEAIKAKIIADTVFYQNRKGCVYIIREGNHYLKPKAEAKILFVINGYILDPYFLPSTLEILPLINDDSITLIQLWEGNIAEAIGGSIATSGIVILHSNSRKLDRQIKRILKRKS
jgi:hypothetical protein